MVLRVTSLESACRPVALLQEPHLFERLALHLEPPPLAPQRLRVLRQGLEPLQRAPLLAQERSRPQELQRRQASLLAELQALAPQPERQLAEST